VSAASWRTTLRDLLGLRDGTMHPAQYVAVLTGVRRSIDDWIPAAQFESFRQLASALGLAIEVDCVFSPAPQLHQPYGAQFAPTTQALGKIFSKPSAFAAEDEVHVVVAKRPECAAETLGAAWYPVVTQDRVLYKPRIDVRRLGLAFGYPECCVNFFMEHNDWPRQNTIAEAAKASRSFSWKANCLPKNTPYMLIFHMPCSFDCRATLEYSASLLRELHSFDQDCARRIERFLKQVFLSVSERLAFVLVDGVHDERGRTCYTGVESLQKFVGLRDPLHDTLGQALESGREINIIDGAIFVWSRGDLKAVIETSCDMQVAEVPLVLDFVER
jgi:hypothetical protein